jgi:hypothetical protein
MRCYDKILVNVAAHIIPRITYAAKLLYFFYHLITLANTTVNSLKMVY